MSQQFWTISLIRMTKRDCGVPVLKVGLFSALRDQVVLWPTVGLLEMNHSAEEWSLTGYRLVSQSVKSYVCTHSSAKPKYHRNPPTPLPHLHTHTCLILLPAKKPQYRSGKTHTLTHNSTLFIFLQNRLMITFIYSSDVFADSVADALFLKNTSTAI